jgi:hypothetical protein
MSGGCIGHLKVNEKGTAAAVVVPAERECFLQPQKPYELRADKRFVFLIQESSKAAFCSCGGE